MPTPSIDLVKQVAAVLYRNGDSLDRALKMLSDAFSAIDFQGRRFPFVETDYYKREMGSGLKRFLLSFETLIDPGCLMEAKTVTQHIEERLSSGGNRTVNLDIGYLDIFKLMLASRKARSNKIYLGNQVWADMILYYEKGDYQPFVWSFPDFKSGIYNRDLKTIRTIYKKQLKKCRENIE